MARVQLKTYKLLKMVMLSFTTPRDQFDVLIDPKEGTFVESDGSTLWLIQGEKRHESITQAHYVEDTESFEEVK